MTTLPPFSPADRPEASSEPLIATTPFSPPPRMILPWRCATVLASTMPDMLIAWSSTFLARLAVICTVPPSARILPALLTAALMGWPSGPTICRVTLSSTAMLISLSPKKSTVKLLADTSATLPRRALITPLLATPGATSATRPPSATLIVPSLTTVAFGLVEGWLKLYLPARKSSLRILVVLAISPPTSTREPAPNRIPFGFMSMILPLAVICPRITEGSTPVTRLSVTDAADGWL